jgi:3-hydroxybutyryl-CoA dehydrogenase
MESSVCICGAGTMGRGITLTVAGSGMAVLLYDLNPEVISGAAAQIEKELEADVEKKRISREDKTRIKSLITYSSDISRCRAPLIIEAVIEKTDVKSSLFRELALINDKETIYATNTSSLSVTSIAGQTPFPERIIGLHFFNPANRMKLVEIIRTRHNKEEILKRVTDFVQRLHKIPVVCQDAPGFIVNHVARPFYLEALRLAEGKVADIGSIDKLMESAGFKMGPFHLMDLIGNDINYTVSCSLYETLGKPARLRPSRLQEEKVGTGALGKKTGRGFFEYAKPVTE